MTNEKALNFFFLDCAITFFFTTPLIIHHLFGDFPLFSNELNQALWITPVLLIGFFRIIKPGIRAVIVQKDCTMYTLISMSVIASLLYSIYALISGEGITSYFETTSSIIMFTVLGGYLEYQAEQQMHEERQILMKKLPETATILNQTDDKEEVLTVPIKKIKAGDTVIVSQGEQIPVNGTVTSGKALVDESMITGEATLIPKETGASLLSGTLLIEGSLVLTAQATAENSFLGKIVSQTHYAQNKSLPIQRLGDTISSYFVPGVLGISLITFLVSFFIFSLSFEDALLRSLAILVISCPCAVGLATPAVVAVAFAVAARRNIIILKGELLERFTGVSHFVFDKTGTLSHPINPTLVILDTHKKYDEAYLISVIRALTNRSNHPYSRFLRELSLENKEVSSFEGITVKEHPGKGLEGVHEDTTFFLGSYTAISHLTENDSYSLYITINDELVAGIESSEEPVTEADAMIKELQSRSYKTIMLSGDSEARCKRIAEILALDEYYAEQLPSEKLARIEALESQKNFTCYVGDGSNDSPALAAARVAIALKSGTALAQQTAHALIPRKKLYKVNELRILSELSLRVIKENYWWAFGYNLIAIPLASLGVISPLWAAFFMASSDLVVVCNALFLKKRFNKKLALNLLE